MNQTLEQYLRSYINYEQDNWHELLPGAEFAYNNAKHAVTGVSPFFAVYGHHPRFTTLVSSMAEKVPAAHDFARAIQNLHSKMRERLVDAQEYQGKHYNKKHLLISFEPGAKVWLLPKHINTTRPSKKLDFKRLGPFEITKRIGKQAYRLDIKQLGKSIHDVFHVSLLEPYTPNAFPSREPLRPTSVQVDDTDIPEYHIEKVLDSRRRRGRGRHVDYLVHWKDYEISDDSWEHEYNLTNAQELVQEFHERNPQKPRGSIITSITGN